MANRQIALGPDLPPTLGRALRKALTDDDPSAFVRELELLIGVTVSGVVLYGGLVQSTSFSEIESSDVDLLVLVDEKLDGGIFGTSDGLQIDLHIENKVTSISDVATNWLYAYGRPLFDRCAPDLSHWLNYLNEWIHANSNPWTEVEFLRSRVWAARLVAKVIRLQDIDPALAYLHEGRLLASIPLLHAQSQQVRTTSISNWWRKVKDGEPQLHQMLTEYIEHRTRGFDGRALETVINRLFRSAPPRDYEEARSE